MILLFSVCIGVALSPESVRTRRKKPRVSAEQTIN